MYIHSSFLLWYRPVCVWCMSVHVCIYTVCRGCQSLPDLCPNLDVHHKHNQDEKQSTGQAGAVPRDPLHSLPDGPQPGLRVSEPLLRCDRGLHPGHCCSPVSGRSASLYFFPRWCPLKGCPGSWQVRLPRLQSKSKVLWPQPCELQLLAKYPVPFLSEI